MRLLITSDWHLDATTAGVERAPDLQAAVSAVLEAVKEERVDAFAFLGDLTDPDDPRAWRAVEFAVRTARWLKDEGVEQLWLVGNHDVVEDGKGSSVLLPLRAAGAMVVDVPAALFFGGVAVLAFPFTPRSHAYDPAEFARTSEFPLGLGEAGRAVVLSHLCVEGIEPGSETTDFARGREVFLPLEELEREHGSDLLVFNGHYHRRQTFRRGGVEVHVPGSLARLTRGERENCPGYLIAEV